MLTELPVLPGLHIDAQYVMGKGRRCTDRAWFDVTNLGDGRTAMMVGDVVEQGISAEARTTRVRAILTHMLADGHDLDAVLEAINAAGSGWGTGYATTFCVAIIDPASGNVQYCTCDHSPPMVVQAQGRTRHLRSTGGEDLGKSLAIAIDRDRLYPDDVLVLHTGGGSTESRGTVTAGLAGLPHASDHPNSAMHGPSIFSARTETVCRTMTAGIKRTGGRADLAVLAVQSRPALPRLELTVPAVVASLEPAGQAVGDWLAGLRSSVEDGAGMALAVGEAMANAIQHAFTDMRTGSVMVEAMLLADGVLVCSVSDDGHWLSSEPSQPGRGGRGMRLMARVCDRMLIHREAHGTVIELRRRLRHPVIRSGSAGSPSG